MSQESNGMRGTHAEVWQILVEECGANPDGLGDFAMSFPDCVEYRFQGRLGFGGKVWRATYPNHANYVNTYSEDITPERARMIDAANARMAALKAPSLAE